MFAEVLHLPLGRVGPGIDVSAEPLPIVNPFYTQMSPGFVHMGFEASCTWFFLLLKMVTVTTIRHIQLTLS
jgi:hypothetical protein